MTHKQYDCNAHNTISKETSDKMKLNDLRRQNLEGHNSCQYRSMGSLILTDPRLRERAGEGGGGGGGLDMSGFLTVGDIIFCGRSTPLQE